METPPPAANVEGIPPLVVKEPDPALLGEVELGEPPRLGLPRKAALRVESLLLELTSLRIKDPPLQSLRQGQRSLLKATTHLVSYRFDRQTSQIFGSVKLPAKVVPLQKRLGQAQRRVGHPLMTRTSNRTGSARDVTA